MEFIEFLRDIGVETTNITYKPGFSKLQWAYNFMPVCKYMVSIFRAKKALKDKKIAMCIHGEAKSAIAAIFLKALGAEVFFTGSNPLSTQDDVMEVLQDCGVQVAAKHGCTMEEYFEYLKQATDFNPHYIIDDGGDLLDTIEKMETPPSNFFGGAEETTTGVIRLQQKAAKKELKYPMIAVNDAEIKYLFDNRYGSAQSVLTGIMNTTNTMIAGRYVVVAGYGWVGKGVAKAAKAMGAKVIVTEIAPIPALEACYDGMEVMTMDLAAPIGNIFITCTGCCDVITEKHINRMQNEAILCNAGHFDSEINVNDLQKLASYHYKARENIETYVINDKHINLIADGRLVNLAAGQGHPAEIMDTSLAMQITAMLELKANADAFAKLKPEKRVIVFSVTPSVMIANIKLNLLGLKLDVLTEAQRKYYYGEESVENDEK